MFVSMRAAKLLMRRIVPGKRVSDDAARLLSVYLERRAEELTAHAFRIHEVENQMRAQLGERPKATLTKRHVKMAIEGKFLEGAPGGRVN